MRIAHMKLARFQISSSNLIYTLFLLAISSMACATGRTRETSLDREIAEAEKHRHEGFWIPPNQELHMVPGEPKDKEEKDYGPRCETMDLSEGYKKQQIRLQEIISELYPNIFWEFEKYE